MGGLTSGSHCLRGFSFSVSSVVGSFFTTGFSYTIFVSGGGAFGGGTRTFPFAPFGRAGPFPDLPGQSPVKIWLLTCETSSKVSLQLWHAISVVSRLAPISSIVKEKGNPALSMLTNCWGWISDHSVVHRFHSGWPLMYAKSVLRTCNCRKLRSGTTSKPMWKVTALVENTCCKIWTSPSPLQRSLSSLLASSETRTHLTWRLQSWQSNIQSLCSSHWMAALGHSSECPHTEHLHTALGLNFRLFRIRNSRQAATVLN
mmetsp:Transcript_100588/g.173765  ORF Transcript_100588/g.173765 Transcript_100588/m.173765 type:complete len:258 (-) Transcript_100588:242-1015(-)